ncbi:MAG: hypothetical protein JWP11_2868 [Frankiales bacterium]|nr:hypothetical protein [Frankiales bacterium]
MSAVPLAAHERLSAAFARYDALWGTQGDDLPAARLELCLALLACGETLPAPVLAQMERDRAAVSERVVIEV